MNRLRHARRLSMLAAAACSLVAGPLAAQDAPPSDDPAAGAIRVYQHHLSAMRHMHCRFAPSCSQYAMDAIATYGVVEGSARAADRLMRCNSSAESRYPRNSEGLLVDPVGESLEGMAAVRVPPWLLPAPEGPEPPIASALAPDRRTRLAEALEFSLQLERRGDCERASAEYQRAGMLADTLAAHAWAYARIANCYFGASQWYLADRAYLTSAMLTRDEARRANVGFAAAASRFNAGAFVSCGRLLADSALSPPVAAGGAAAAIAADSAGAGVGRGPAPGEGVTTLAGMCSFALGEWAAADSTLMRAASESRTPDMRARVRLLAAFASQGPELPHRSPGLAGSLSAIVPGSGQAYSGSPRDGVRHLLFNAALIYTVVALANNDLVPAAVIAGSVALPFYVGNVLGASAAARRFNRERRLRLLERAIAESAR